MPEAWAVYLLFIFLLTYFRRGSCSVAQVGSIHTTLLSLLTKCWNNTILQSERMFPFLRESVCA